MQYKMKTKLMKYCQSINIKIQKAYEKYANSTDQQAPFKFEKDLAINNFEVFLKDKSKPVKKLLTNKIAEKKALLVPKLVGQVIKNLVDKFKVNLDKYLIMQLQNDF